MIDKDPNHGLIWLFFLIVLLCLAAMTCGVSRDLERLDRRIKVLEAK